MRTLKFFITGILCLFFFVRISVAQNLNTRISIKVKDATLPQVLQQLQKKYGYRFSYLNNELPAKTRFSAEISNRPLSEVLDVLLEKTDMGYKQTNGQIIIKKGFPKNKPKTTTFQELAPPRPEKPVENKPAQTVKTEAPKPQPVKPQAAKPEAKVANEKTPVTEPEKKPEIPENITVKNTIPADEKLGDSVTVIKMAGQKVTLLDKLANIREKNENLAANADTILINDYHFGLIYPISTNGVMAGRFVNKFSAHLLIGTSAGLDGIELSGFGNVERSYVGGVQAAGFFNIAKNSLDLTALADTRNEGYTLNGWQFAGFFNLANGNARGAQFGGFMNATNGRINGAQFAGFLNIARDVSGVQGAGYMNLAKNVEGPQLAGFLNIADTVSGMQGAGFLNVARHVKGTQIAFINVADSVSGVPIGLFSFVNKGGYKHAEFYAAEDFDANFAFKLGVAKFYTFIALGAELKNENRWGYGFGFGREWQTARYFKINTDLMAYQVIEESYKNFPDEFLGSNYLNLQNKFRVLGTLQIARHLSLFAGPTFNVSVSQFQAANSSEIGSTLPARSFYDRTFNNQTNVKMGFGFNAGVRF